MSDFAFISNPALRSNIDQVNDLVVELVLLSESEGYKNRSTLVSSLRKTVLVYTAIMIEALLLWKLKAVHKSEQIELEDEWIYKDPHKIYKMSNSEEIIWCRRKKVNKNIEKLDFLRIIRSCKKYSIIKNKKLVSDIDRVRILRNKLHIGGLVEVECEYKIEDLEFCFSTLNRVKEVVAKE